MAVYWHLINYFDTKNDLMNRQKEDYADVNIPNFKLNHSFLIIKDLIEYVAKLFPDKVLNIFEGTHLKDQGKKI